MKNKTGKIFLILSIFVCSGFFIVVNPALADRTIISATLDGANSVTVKGGDSITAALTVKLTSTSKWKMTGYKIGNGILNCINTTDHITAGTYTETFMMGAPLVSDGNYDVSFFAYLEDGSCRDSNAHATSTLIGGIIVDGENATSSVDSLTASSSNSLGSSSAADNSSQVTGPRFGDVVINEFVSSPAAGENEWVELYNPSGGKFSLDGWTITDGSGAVTVLTGGFGGNNYYFFVKEKFKGALNNDGDKIILSSAEGNLIDKVIYGKFGDDSSENAPVPGKGESAALKIDGRKSLYDKDSFVLTDSPTKGKKNIVSAVASEDTATSTADETSAQVSITEIFPNPKGSDREGEFIELYNSSDKEIDLTGWRLEIKGGRSFEFGEFFNKSRKISAGGFLVLYRAESNLILDNNGGEIKLFAPGKSRAAQILQYDSAEEGLSFADTQKLDLQKPSTATKNFLNNSLSLKYWVWSETPTPGAANQIKTPNHPPQAIFFAPAKIITGEPADFDASDSFDEDGDAISYEWDFGDGVRLNLEAPEHIFLRSGNYEVKLAASDGQETAEVKKIIKVSGISLLAGKEKIAANNSPIILPEKSVDEKKSAEKQIASRQNFVSPAVKDFASTKSAIKVSVVAPSKSSAISLTKNKLGASLKKSGTVIVLPGVFGVQYFYILDAAGETIKIYNYYKDFPKLALGDSIEASGVVGGSASDRYLKTKTAADIKILGKAEMPAPEKIIAADFKDENLNKFVKIEGEVQEKNGSQISLANGTGTISLYLKSNTGVSAASFKAGEKITATGILSRVSGKLAILPRGQFDIAAASSSTVTQDVAFLQSTGSSDWTMPRRDNSPRPVLYFSLVAVSFVVFSVIVFWKKRK
jgi:DNA/RNA endonuclease YhcR with UshA esterase domain